MCQGFQVTWTRTVTGSTLSARRAFADDVRYYLAQSPRQLPSKHLYDALGSALFDAITQLPWYTLTRAERGLLERHGREVFAAIDGVSVILELGPGNGEKLLALLEGAPRERAHEVCLIDVSGSALARAAQTLATRHETTVVCYEDTYDAGLVRFREHRDARRRALALFLGSNIGNFDPPGCEAFLRNLAAALMPGDALLLGTDLVKPERDLLLAYDDPLGVTAAFNRNLLVRINRELDADIDVNRFAHRAVWNDGASRIEMHLVSREAQIIRIPAARFEVSLAAGETIWTESSYKYRPADVVALLERNGFEVRVQWVESANPFALTLATLR